jgi:hypothetical protein
VPPKSKQAEREPRIVRHVWIYLEQAVRMRDGSEALRQTQVWRGEVAHVTPEQAALFDLALMPAGATIEDMDRERELRQAEYRQQRQSVGRLS